MIQEDPDNLGYWMRPAHGGYPNPPAWNEAMSSLIVCNSIIPPETRDDIEEAAELAYDGQDRDAERHRKYAGYGSLGFRADADGPVRLNDR